VALTKLYSNIAKEQRMTPRVNQRSLVNPLPDLITNDEKQRVHRTCKEKARRLLIHQGPLIGSKHEEDLNSVERFFPSPSSTPFFDLDGMPLRSLSLMYVGKGYAKKGWRILVFNFNQLRGSISEQ